MNAAERMKLFTRQPTSEFLSVVRCLVGGGVGVFGLDLLLSTYAADALTSELCQPVSASEAGQALAALGYPRKNYFETGITGPHASSRVTVLRNREYWMSKQARAPQVRDYLSRIPGHLAGLKALAQ